MNFFVLAEDVKTIDQTDEFNPNHYYVSLTSHAEQFGVNPVRIRVRTQWMLLGTYLHGFSCSGDTKKQMFEGLSSVQTAIIDTGTLLERMEGPIVYTEAWRYVLYLAKSLYSTYVCVRSRLGRWIRSFVVHKSLQAK